MKTGIIIQARMGATRMPGKVLRPFCGSTILGMITKNLRSSKHHLPVVIATSVAPGDDVIAGFCKQENISCYRGPEDDVLERFIGAAETHGFEKIVRVCADNPFLDVELMDRLLGAEEPADYASYLVDDGLPAIKSHWGVFTEVTTLEALKKVRALTNEKLYHEHVTNFMYANPGTFRLHWLDAPAEVYGRRDVRFTIDTLSDFETMERLASVLAERGIPVNFRHALRLLDEFPELKKAMQLQISDNSK